MGISKTRMAALLRRNPESALLLFMQEIEKEIPDMVESAILKHLDDFKATATKEIQENIENKDFDLISETVNKNVNRIIRDVKGKTGDTGNVGKDGADGQPPSDKKMMDLIKIVVTGMQDVLRGDQGDMPSVEEMESTVRSVVSTLSSELRGKPPTKREVRSLILDTLNSNRSAFQGLQGKEGKKGDDGNEGSPDTPEQIKGKLLQLPVESAWFDVRHIRGLPSVAQAVQRALHRGGSVTRSANLASQVDDSTTVFTVPSHSSAIALFGSDFPTIYFPNAQFTSSGQSLTLSAGIDAPTEGSFLVFLYNE